MATPHEPRFEFLYAINVELAAPIDIGATPHGHRMIVPLAGGSFEGPALKGKVLPGGGDWLVVRPDGMAELDVRGTLQTDDGALIYVSYKGLISRIMEILPRFAAGEAFDRNQYYFMAAPSFETSSERYAWLQQTVAVAIGELTQGGGVTYRVYAVSSQIGTSPVPTAAMAATV